MILDRVSLRDYIEKDSDVGSRKDTHKLSSAYENKLWKLKIPY